ncbi:MAG: twin arginine-targeting protein translocase TatB [Desulfobacteraceae bacterium IS3]|nr:MAG: twin arginine-targeting protein translocase TatB [Desulfobacteraceae bacterium IS3]
MFGIGMPELILILIVALIVVGPKKLPDIAKSMGRAIGEFRKATTEFKESIGVDTELKEVKKAFNDMNSDAKKPIEIKAESENKTPAVPTPTGEEKNLKEEKAETPGGIREK